MLPDLAKVSDLEVRHKTYTYLKPTWETIADLKEGATAITKKASIYLPPRPGEKPDVYALRLKKLSYTPVMSSAIQKFTSKLIGSPIHIDGVDTDFWGQFREATDGNKRDEKDLLDLLFSTALYYGRVFAAVDRPALGIQPRSAFEEQGLKNQPYVIVYDPLSVPNWGDSWYLTRQLNDVMLPLQQPKVIATWTFWDTEAITVYEAEVRLNGESITEVKVGERWLGVNNPETYVSMKSRVAHNLGRCPLHALVLPPEMWTGNNVYLKQLQHLLIESSWTDAGVMAGTIQRVFTPLPPKQVDDPLSLTEDTDYSDIKADNAHILIGQDFKFQESSGSAITSLTGQLETIERQIKALVSMDFASSNKGALQQSGTSKEVDMTLLEDSMKSYGAKMVELYQDILQTVAKWVAYKKPITVSGLDSYGVNILEDMLEASLTLEDISERIPVTAKKLWYGKVTSILAGSRSAETDENINKELDQIDFSKPLPNKVDISNNTDVG